MARAIRWLVSVAIFQWAVFLVVAGLLPGVRVHRLGASLVGGLVIMAALSLVWWLLYTLAARLHPAPFPLLTFVASGLAVAFAGDLVNAVAPGAVEIRSLWSAMLAALLLAAGFTLLGVVFALDDAAAYDRLVVQPLRRRYRDTPRSASPAVLFLEIDGLAEPILRDALAGGYLPTLGRWLDTGSHRLAGWEPDLSSQTSASQAGILLGDNRGIPAFRWYDKGAGRLMASSSPATARALERRLSTGRGLLARDGGSRWNVFSGDAPDCLGVFSRLGERDGGGHASYYLYFANPYTLARALGLFLADLLRERWQARQQRRRDVRPRVDRDWPHALARAATTVLQEASLFMLLADMFRGVPAVYTTFFGYDKVAHHSGIDRPETFQVLRALDRLVATLERAARRAPRPYHLVVLSDHGQSQGATFRQRYGCTLGELVDRLLADGDRPGGRVEDLGGAHEHAAHLDTALGEALRGGSRALRLARCALRARPRNGRVALDPARRAEEEAARRARACDVVVLASGNLGLVSFPGRPGRLTLEQLSAAYPGLLPGLLRHEGIGFVLVRSEVDGGLVLGPRGAHYLERGHTVGEDPLAPFGPRAAAHLRRTDSFPNAPDILVMSRYDPASGEVAAFEELVGSHGGLGGPQTQPFVLYPATLPLDLTMPIVGAAALHARLKSWVDQV